MEAPGESFFEVHHSALKGPTTPLISECYEIIDASYILIKNVWIIRGIFITIQMPCSLGLLCSVHIAMKVAYTSRNIDLKGQSPTPPYYPRAGARHHLYDDNVGSVEDLSGKGTRWPIASGTNTLL